MQLHGLNEPLRHGSNSWMISIFRRRRPDKLNVFIDSNDVALEVGRGTRDSSMFLHRLADVISRIRQGREKKGEDWENNITMK